MKVVGLNGRIYSLKLKKKKYNNASKLHIEVKDLLRLIFPFDEIFEEVVLPGCNKLRLDFLIPKRNLAFEVQGKQHYEYNYFFHKHIHNFNKSVIRDRNKNEWCIKNNITLVLLDERNKNEWESIIRKN